MTATLLPAESSAVAHQVDRTVTRWLGEARALERQALLQMRRVSDAAGTAELSAAFRAHLTETEDHEHLVEQRLCARGGGEWGAGEQRLHAGAREFGLFAQLQPETPGQLAAHAYSYEHLELGWYLVLQQAAAGAGDGETAVTAWQIAEQERAMARRLQRLFDRVVDALPPDDLDRALTAHLADAHAIEAQSASFLRGAAGRSGDERLRRIYAEHLAETRRHSELLEQALRSLGRGLTPLEDARARLGALDWSAFFEVEGEAPVKLATVAYAFEHLEIAGYQQLLRVAGRRGDGRATDAARRILAEERVSAQRLATTLPIALRASLPRE